jgi:protease-4
VAKRRTVFILAACVAAVALGAALVGGMALMLRSGGGTGRALSTEEYLDVHIDGEIPERPAVTFGAFLERQPPSLRTLLRSIERAADDSRVKALVLRVGVAPGAGWGKIEELRTAITRFRKSGKPAYAHLEYAGNKEYYLATACSKIYAVPTAILDVTGLAAEVTFFRGTLDKLGVQAQFEGVGKYKNAPNQFTERGFTEPHREQTEALLDSLYGDYTRAIATARGKSAEDVKALVDDGPYDGHAALKAGLVDELAYYDELLDEELEGAARVTPGRYVRSAWRDFSLGGRPKVAVIYVVGEIVSGESAVSGFGGEGFAGSDTIARAIRQARQDDDIKAIVVRVDSPGGSGTASDVIWRELRLARAEKPVIASMSDVAASGGYYIAMASDLVVAQPTTITGSIGVFAGKFSLRGLYEKIGLTEELVTRGENAALFSLSRPWNEAERKKVRRFAEVFYEEFLKKAAECRKHTEDEIHAVAQGRVWTGRDAVAGGLVDELGGLSHALDLAKQRARIDEDEELEIVVLPTQKTLWETLFDDEDTLLESHLPPHVRALLRWARSTSGGFLSARLPFELRIR